MAASLALMVTPGPDMMFILARGVSGGSKTGLLSASGVATGILVHTLIAASGLGLVIATSPLIFALIKYAGAGYLIYLGLSSVMAKTSGVASSGRDLTAHRAAYWQGVLTNVFNPKVALFFLAFLSQFVPADADNPLLQMALYGVGLAGMTALGYGLLGYYSGNVGAWLRSREGLEIWVHRGSGLILIALGARLVILQSP